MHNSKYQKRNPKAFMKFNNYSVYYTPI